MINLPVRLMNALSFVFIYADTRTIIKKQRVIQLIPLAGTWSWKYYIFML